ncbi:MAG: DUF488 domain-containing protein [Anaerolineales bacterium]|nr:DUF488 domain-containing protein [Anaerolineales bacterium]
MFYRQKILLALVEVSGKRLNSTDLLKLLFLFCQETGQNHYDFFPHKFGAFSFMVDYDKRKLIEQGHLESAKYYQLPPNKSFLDLLRSKDKAAVTAFAHRTRNLRGRQLIRKTYLEYPEYCARSTILSQVLSIQERMQIQAIQDRARKQTLFTIGYEGSTIDNYLRRLVNNDIAVLIDIRRNPFSRKHGFSKKSLQGYLQRASIQYRHMPELGIASHLRRSLTDEASYRVLFDLYTQEILPGQTQALEQIKLLTQQFHRVALTCFEANPCMCHRHKVTEAFEQDPDFRFQIQHI